MKKIYGWIFCCILVFVLALVLGFHLFPKGISKTKSQTPSSAAKKERLVVHEWGTFTSIAGNDGIAIEWRPLSAPSDLPKFVYSVERSDSNEGLRHSPTRNEAVATSGKSTRATIRMETPVIYFYTDAEMDVSVKVDFPKGRVTEWYPQARSINKQTDKIIETNHAIVAGGEVDWGKFKLMPSAGANFLKEKVNSHYYPARETDAVPLRVCGKDKSDTEYEKFLFYRGIGTFDLPLTVRLDETNAKQIFLANRGAEAIKNLIVFENRGGHIGFKTLSELNDVEAAIERPVLNQSLDDVLAELKSLLIAQGLYEKEARAMIETWRDSWFEEGLRVFYVLPRKTTDEILPLQIEPKPQEVVRALVGRAEVITPEMEKEVKTKVGLLKSSSPSVRNEAMKDLQKHGRFYEPILKSILKKEADANVRAQLEKLIAAKA